ncbi:MAG: hypothetical protein AAF393_06990 [Pseudomonadota bacterium]
MVNIKYFYTSTLAKQHRPFVKLPGKQLQRVVNTGIFPKNKEIQSNINNLKVLQRKKFQKKLKVIVPTMASEHWLQLETKWQVMKEEFTDPKTNKKQLLWSVEFLVISSYGVECPMGYDLSAKLYMLPAVTKVRGGISMPDAKARAVFESIGPTGAKEKTTQEFGFGFLQGKLLKTK